MNEELKQAVQYEIEKLSTERRGAINSIDWISGIEKISNSFGLIPQEKNDLLLETGLVLIGTASIEDFSENIREHVGLTEKESEDVAMGIFSDILIPISDKIVVPENNEGDEKNPSFSGLPKNISTNDSNQKIYEIGTKYKLPVDKMGEVDSVTNKFINGEISSIKYESELSLITELPSDKILEIINDINENIIKPKRNEVLSGEKTDTPKKVPLPPYKKPTIKSEEGKPVESFIEKPTIINSHEIYKEHGIEIINEDENNKELEIKKEKEQINNIVVSKLSGNTNSKNVINDYSIPKITSLTKPNESIKIVDPANPHDPYREIL